MGAVSAFGVVDHLPLADLPHGLKAGTPDTPSSMPACDACRVSTVAHDALRVDGTGVEPATNSPVAEYGGGQPIAFAGRLEVQVGVQIPEEAVV